MEIKFTFEEPMRPWLMLRCARLMCDIQHLCLFAMYLVDDDVTKEFDFLEPYDQKYEYMILGDVNPTRQLDFYSLALWRFTYTSPPEISVGMGYKVGVARKFDTVLNIFKKIIFFEAQRRKQEAEARKKEAEAKKEEAEAEVSRQKAFREYLKNYDRSLGIAKKFKDPGERRQFETNLITALEPFTDGRHPELRNIELPGLPPPEQDKG